MVAVTGHRDLVATEIAQIQVEVRSFLSGLQQRYPDRRLRVMSPLAEGADRLVAELVLELGIELVVPLPMKKEIYLEDFTTTESRAQFETICAAASEVYELPLARGVAPGEISDDGVNRSRQYAQMGVFLCAHCHILLALWDGKLTGDLGGTGQVVKFHHDDIMPGFTAKTVATQQMLVDDESDLVYHIVCSRNRDDGDPIQGLNPLQCCWFTKDREHPRSAEMPRQHQLIFERSAEFSHDALSHATEIDAEKYPLYEKEQEATLPPGVDDINRLFCAADWLAMHFQRKILIALRVTHVLAFLMGLSFILYSDYKNLSYYMLAFLLFFLASAVVQKIARKNAWHRKYLDYRALAEGLRVQFYWAVAGIVNESESKFAHDNFLQTQDPELGWIRNIMRVAGTRCDVKPFNDPRGLEFALREWIGSDESGQLGYFAKKTAERVRRNRLTERLGLVSLLTSVVIVILIVVTGSMLSDIWIDWLMVLMGSSLLLFGIRQGYGYAIAEKDLIKQYEFMLRIFQNARRRLDNAEDSVEQRQILMALGGSALDEHAQWILMHRDRSIDQGEVWRMGS